MSTPVSGEEDVILSLDSNTPITLAIYGTREELVRLRYAISQAIETGRAEHAGPFRAAERIVVEVRDW